MKRPRIATIVGVIVLIQGLIFTAFASLTLGLFGARLWGTLPPDVVAELPTVRLSAVLFAVTALVMGVVGLVSGVGILRLRSWAWLVAMIAQGINLVTELIDYSRGEANYLSMLISVIIVLYLNQRDVQQVFRVAQHRDDPMGAQAAAADLAAAEEVQHRAAKSR